MSQNQTQLHNLFKLKEDKMAKKLLITGVLVVCILAMAPTGAKAYPPSLGGWAVSWGSITFTTTWLGVGNVAAIPTDVVVTLQPVGEDNFIYFANPAGQTGGIGVPFTPGDIQVEGLDRLDPMTKNGKFTSEITFYTQLGENPEDPLDWILKDVALPEEILEQMPNPGWCPYKVEINHFDAVIQGFTDIIDEDESWFVEGTEYPSCEDAGGDLFRCYGDEEEIVHVAIHCDLIKPDGGTPYYECYEIDGSNWEWSKKDPVYYVPPPSP
jgi:hypothetical protein